MSRKGRVQAAYTGVHFAGSCIDPDGTTVISGSDDKTVRVWDLETGEVSLFSKGDASIFFVCVIRTRIITGGGGGNVLFFSPENIPAGIPAVTTRKDMGELTVRCLYCYRFFGNEPGETWPGGGLPELRGESETEPVCGGGPGIQAG